MDETIGWIKEKEQLMASDDFGRDLASVQALLRKHEGLERDLAALEDKVSLFVCLLACFPETGYLCEVLAVLELTI